MANLNRSTGLTGVSGESPAAKRMIKSRFARDASKLSRDTLSTEQGNFPFVGAAIEQSHPWRKVKNSSPNVTVGNMNQTQSSIINGEAKFYNLDGLYSNSGPVVDTETNYRRRPGKIKKKDFTKQFLREINTTAHRDEMFINEATSPLPSNGHLQPIDPAYMHPKKQASRPRLEDVLRQTTFDRMNITGAPTMSANWTLTKALHNSVENASFPLDKNQRRNE